MPRGRQKKNTAVEVLPPEDATQPMREVKHTAQWVEVRPVEESTTDDDSEEDFDYVEEEKAKRRRKTSKDERDEFKRELDKLGVASVSRLKLSIDKYRHSDSDDSGTLAEKDYCVKYPVTKEHILSDEYMDVARRYGPGRYWFTLRMDNKIIRQWERQVSAVVTPTGPTIQYVNPADPSSPQFIIQANGDGQQVAAAPSVRDIMRSQKDALKEHLEMTKLMREAYGFTPEQQQPKSEEEVLTSAILKQPEVIENVVGSVIKRFGGSGGKEDEPWYAKIVEEAVKSGQAAQVVKTAIDSIFFGFKGLFPGGQQNGQAEMAQAPLQNQQANQAPIPEGVEQSGEGMGSLPAARPEGASVEQNQPVQISPEEQALARMVDNCQRRVPVQVAFDQLIQYADAINDQAPQYSIDGYISMFAQMTPDQALEFVKTRPGGEQVAALSHAKEWTAALQQLIQNSQEGEEQ